MPFEGFRSSPSGTERRASGSSARAGSSFVEASAPARALIVGSLLAAAGLALVPARNTPAPFGWPSIAVAALLVAGSIGSVELGRFFEGRVVVGQRPHKALSLWAFATALALPPIWLLVVVPLGYAHAYWRGLRPPVWRWVGSAAFVILAGVAAHHAVYWLSGHEVIENRASGIIALLAGIPAFLAVELLLFFLMSRINHPEQELWFGPMLAGPSFYITELAMLFVGALTVVVWARLPWFGLLLVPVYALVQQAALFDPLRREAARDDKTGLLRWEPWRARTVLLSEELSRSGRSWAIVMVDLDHFATFNERHGHLAADDVLVQVARAIEGNVRAGDLVCRFGGEEFALLLVDAGEREAGLIAQRLRDAIAQTSRPPVTASVGVAAVFGRAADPVHGAQLRHALMAADRALYDAKTAGRNRVIVHLVAA